MDETLYRKLLEMVKMALSSGDEDEKELATDLVKAAIKYTGIRASWNYMSINERALDDANRTACHNRLIDCFNIFLRYEGKTGKGTIDMTGYNRKVVGDVGNRLVCDLAIMMR